MNRGTKSELLSSSLLTSEVEKSLRHVSRMTIGLSEDMDINEMIKEGLDLIQNDPQNDLNISFRCRLISSFDERGTDIGRMRRVKLGALGVNKVLPLWESLFPNDLTVHRALELANDLLSGITSPAIAEREMGKLWTHCDDLSWSLSENQHVVMVGYGAAQVIREALSRKHFGCQGVNAQTTDSDVDPLDHDPAFCAVIAYSGGVVWDQSSNPSRRLEYWTWWLNHAVVSAMGSA